MHIRAQVHTCKKPYIIHIPTTWPLDTPYVADIHEHMRMHKFTPADMSTGKNRAKFISSVKVEEVETYARRRADTTRTHSHIFFDVYARARALSFSTIVEKKKECREEKVTISCSLSLMRARAHVCYFSISLHPSISSAHSPSLTFWLSHTHMRAGIGTAGRNFEVTIESRQRKRVATGSSCCPQIGACVCVCVRENVW